ncbi:MAG: phosphoenolpyruvate mutase [Polyangiaceae bacterium]
MSPPRDPLPARPAGRPATKAARLRALVEGAGTSFLMEAHDGLSAKIVEEAGFEGIWASGFSIAASLGVRDRNEASWTQVVDVAEFMADATTVPILFDGDSGFGDFNTARRLVRKLEQRGIAGVAVEDKTFPKTNSFVRGTSQALAPVDEFAGKLRAMVAARTDPDFVIVARVEALVCGLGLDEALVRANAYADAGADAILVHSTAPHADEVLAFKRAFGDRLPVVIVPTRYFTTPTDVFRDAGFRVVIWANHTLRASLAAMQATVRKIHADASTRDVEDRIAPLSEVFRLQGESEMEALERAFLPSRGPAPRAVVLAASRGGELGELTETVPKCMVDVGGRPILGRILDAFRASGVRDLTVVRGFAKDRVTFAGVRTYDNDAHDATGEVESLACARDALAGPCIVADGDVLFRKYVLEALLEVEGDLVVVVDATAATGKHTEGAGTSRRARVHDWVTCSAPPSRTSAFEDVRMTGITTAVRAGGAHGEWTGLLRTSDAGTRVLRELVDAWPRSDRRTASMPSLLARAVTLGAKVRVVYCHGGWLDVDTLGDVVAGGSFA